MKNSHEIFADFYGDVSDGNKRMALAFGVDPITATSWSRPKASDINPTGSGKNNPVDQAVRAARIIHPHDPARAREIASFLSEVCDKLDRDAGIIEASESASPCEAILRVVESSAKLVKVTLGNCDNPEMINEAIQKTSALLSNVQKLLSCLEELKKNQKVEDRNYV